MRNLKFFSLLRSLNNEEIIAFRKYLKLQHGKEYIALKIFDHIRKYHPDFDAGQKIDADYVYEKLFSEGNDQSKTTRKKVLNAYSELHLWLKDFLLIEKVRQPSFENQVLWLSVLQGRKGMEAEFAKQVTRLYQQANTAQQRTTSDYVTNIVAAYYLYRHLTHSSQAAPDLNIFQHCVDTLDLSMETIRVKIGVEISDLKKVRPGILSEPDLPRLRNPVLLEMYREMQLLITSEKQTHYARLQSMLMEYAPLVALSELNTIFLYLYNYAAARARSNDAFFANALHQLNIFGLPQGFLLKDSVMSAQSFTNIISVAVHVNDLSWASSFVRLQSDFIPEDVRDEAVAVGESTILFAKKSFSEIIQLLVKKEFKNLNLAIVSKTLIIRSYMELNVENHIILDFCETFDSFLVRKRKPKTGLVEAVLAFNRICRQLLAKRTDKNKLIDKINNSRNVIAKDWLLAQAQHYKAQYATRKQSK